MLLFLSKKYFGSRNCLKEVVASIEQGKPLVLVQEQQEDKGGGSLEVLKAECRDDQMRDAIFFGRTPIAWHRISHFQNLSLKLVATEMLRNGPRLRRSISGRPNASEDVVLIQHGEVNVSKLTVPRPLTLWCSAGNPGAAGVATELVASMASNGAAIRVVDLMPDVQALKDRGESMIMLLYLNKDTWVEQGEVLKRDVQAARKLKTSLMILMVHENDTEKGGCKFDDFFGITPQELINDGIYRLAHAHRILERCSVSNIRDQRARSALCLVAVTLPLLSTRHRIALLASGSWRNPWALALERVGFAAALVPYQRAHSACPRSEFAN
eukprot:scaffold87284_cov67-Phaeocystis_antarctica.AAC.8